MTATTNQPRVTIVVTQRERLSAMREALDALYANTQGPFDLVYVAGKLPSGARRWLSGQAQARGFQLVEAGRPLTPAEARNLGAAQARTEFVQFVENDVIPMAGWLDALIACADETEADVVVPLTCEGRPIHTIVHHVGPADEDTPVAGNAEAGRRDYRETLYLQGETRQGAAPKLTRRRTGTCEFHCVLVRRSVFARIGMFDPVIVSKEHLDFSWSLARSGCSIWVEPKAVVTFLVPSHNDPVRISDLPYFLLRWSPGWQRRSHDALKARWGLQEAGFIASRRQLKDWRLVDHVLKPALKRVPVLGRRWGFVERAVRLFYPGVAAAAAIMTWRYDAERTKLSGQGHSSAST